MYLSALVPNPMAWLVKCLPESVPQFDLSDPVKVRAVLTDLLQKGMNHFQHDTLLKQDVNVVRVSSWLIAESMKGAPGIFEENDPELTKKLKETMAQSDSLIKLGLGGRAGLGGGSGVGRGSRGRDFAFSCYNCSRLIGNLARLCARFYMSDCLHLHQIDNQSGMRLVKFQTIQGKHLFRRNVFRKWCPYVMSKVKFLYFPS